MIDAILEIVTHSGQTQTKRFASTEALKGYLAALQDTGAVAGYTIRREEAAA